MNNTKIAVVGGDRRQKLLSDMLTREGFTVKTYAVFCGDEDDAEKCETLETAVCDAGYVVLPLPFSRDGASVNSPDCTQRVLLCEVLRVAPNNAHILAGKISADFKEKALLSGFCVTDYFESEELVIKNLVPTVEGTLQLMMENMDRTVHGSRCLITGFGRIGKLLSSYLNNLGAKVTVCARKRRDIAYTEILGYKGITYGALPEAAADTDCVINTVPAPVITRDILCRLNTSTLIIDLASSPGGVDLPAARSLGLNALRALSLPGKVAPRTAAEIIKDTVVRIIKDTNERSENQ